MPPHRDPATLLTAHRVFRCRDLAEFHSHITSLEGGHSREVDADGPVHIELRQVELAGLLLAVHYASCRMTVEAERTADRDFLVQFPLTGRVVMEVDGAPVVAGPDSGLVMSPGSHVRRRGQPGWTLAMLLDRALVSRRLAVRVGRSPSAPLVFRPLITQASAELRAYALMLLDGVDRDQLHQRPATAKIVAAGFVDLLLALQPHNHEHGRADAELLERHARIRIIDDHLRDHLHEPLTMEDLTRLAGCGTRALQGTFAQYCGTSPMQYVRLRRLRRARELLTAAGPETSVAEVARRTGFEHLGRFATSYREAFGELPSATRKRAVANRRSPAP